MKLLVVIPGFGPDNLELKKKILIKNIQIIKNTYDGDIYLKIFNYGSESCNINSLNINYEETFEKGVIGQFLYKYITPNLISNYDNIILLLDDIELSENTNISQIIKNLNFYNLDILSPILDKTSKFSHKIMVQNKKCNISKIRITGFVEFFCYFMSKNGYLKWYDLLDENSCWLWGIDLALYYKNIKCGLLEGLTIHHYLKGESYKKNLPNPYKELKLNISRFTPIAIINKEFSNNIIKTHQFVDVI